MRRILALLGLLAVLTACGPGTVPPCPTEDAVGPCVWNAHTSGNGLGQSFRVNADQSVTYLP